jgi:hypothetical protein
MNGEDDVAAEEARERALDGALARVLPPPAVPAGFQARLQAALTRAAASEGSRAEELSRARRDQRERLAALDADYLRLRRRTLGTLIGGAFAAGAGVAVALPWLTANFGSNAVFVLAAAGALIGLAIGTASWIGRPRLPNLLGRL